MDKRNKRILARAAFIIPAFAVSSFFAVIDIGYASQARDLFESLESTESHDFLVEGYESDAKWMQINDRVVLQPWDTNEVTDASFLDEVPFPSNVLPGFTSLKQAVNRVADRDRYENVERETSRSFAWVQAGSFCKMAKRYTPEQLAKDDGNMSGLVISDEMLPNLPLYSEYCGIDAMAYGDAISKKLDGKKPESLDVEAPTTT